MTDDDLRQSTALQLALDINTETKEYAKSRNRTILVHAKRPAVRLAEGSQPALEQRRVGQDPAIEGGVAIGHTRESDAVMPLKRVIIAVVDDLRSQMPPRKGLSQLSGSLWRWGMDARNI